MEIRNKKEEILELLTEKNYGLTIEEISNHLEINRATGSKYLAILEAEKKVIVRSIGKAKLHYLYGNYTNGLNGHTENNGIKLGSGILVLLLFSSLFLVNIDLAEAYQTGFSVATDSLEYQSNKDVYVYISGPSNTWYSLKVYGPQGNLVEKRTDQTTSTGTSYAKLAGYFETGRYRISLEKNGEAVAEATIYIIDNNNTCIGCMQAPKTTTTSSTTSVIFETTTATSTSIDVLERTTSTQEEGYLYAITESIGRIIGSLDETRPEESESNLTENTFQFSEVQKVTGIDISMQDILITEIYTEKNEGMEWKKAYTINTEKTELRDVFLTSVAEGEALYECTDWDSIDNACAGVWKKKAELAEGTEYDLRIDPSLTAYAEGSSTYGLAVSSKEGYGSEEEPEIALELNDESGSHLDTEINAVLYTPSGARGLEADEIQKTSDGSYAIKLKKAREFMPGVYKIRAEAVYDGVQYIEEREFVWGVLALNLHKSVYLPGDIAEIGMAVLNREGRMVCDADMELEITKPDKTIDILSTGNGLIHVSPECEFYGVTELPDYYASYEIKETGTYLLKLAANTIDGARTLETNLSVKESVDYDVARHGPTRIYPVERYRMDYVIKANEDYNGEVVERVPSSFVITPAEGLSIEDDGETKTLRWSKELSAGETSVFGYEFDAQDISPYLYRLGPLSMGEFMEEREWMIASDAAGISGMAVYQLSAQATRPAYMNWTGAAWGAAGNTINATGTVQWMILKDNPARDEKILGTLGSASSVMIQLWNSSKNWSTSYMMTMATSTNTRRAFDIGVESGTGRVMAAYNNNTAGSVCYRIWNGTSWSPETALSIGGTAQIEWIKIAQSNSSNRMMLLAQTAATATYADLYAVPWNGTTWLAPVLLEDQLEQEATECFDAAFEYLSDEVLVVWSDQASSAARYNTYSFSTGWGSEGAGYDGGTANIVNLRLAPYPGTDRIMMCYYEGSAGDLDCQEWGGIVFYTGVGVDTSCEINSGTRNFDVAANNASNGFLVIYGDNNLDYFSFAHCNSTTRCQAGTWDMNTIWSGVDIGFDTSWVQLYPAPGDPGKFMALMLDQQGTSGWWKGRLSCTASACTSLEAPNSLGAVSSVAYESAFFAFDRYEPPKQTLLSVWDETDNKPYGGVVKYVNQATAFYANYTNASNYPVNATLAPDASCKINIYNRTAWTGWLTMTYNATKTLYEYNFSGFSYPGNFAWNISCNASGYASKLANDTVLINNTAPDTVIDAPKPTDWFARADTEIMLRCNASDLEDAVENISMHFSWDESSGYGSPSPWIVNDTATENPFSVAFNAVTDSECSEANIGATGTCYYQCLANDSFNKTDASPAQSSFGIDGEAPTGYSASISGYPEDSWLTGTSFTIKCSGASDPGSGSGVSAYDYEYTSADDCLSGWATVGGCSDIAGDCSWNTPPSDEAGFCLRCRATDAVGNDGSWDDAHYGGIDNSAPSTCSVVMPQQYYNITTSPYELASEESDAYSGMNNVTFQYYDGAWKDACVGTSAASSYNCSWTVPGGIEDWRNISIRAVCFDNVSLSTTSANASNISIDTVNSAPACAVIYPNGGENLSGTVLVSASAENTDAADYIDEVSFNYSADNGATWGLIGTNTSNGLPSYSLEWDTNGLNGEGFMVKCIAKDSHGSSGTDDSDNNFTVDNTMPETSSPHINDSVLAMSEMICLNLTVTDNIELESVWAEIDVPEPGSDVNLSLYDDGLGCDASSGDDVYSASYQVAYDGSHNWTNAYANDSAGNLNWSIVGLNWTVSSDAFMTVEMLAPTSDLEINESGGNNLYIQTCNVTCDPGGTACQNVFLYAEYDPGTWTDVTTETIDLVNDADNHSCGTLSPGSSCSHSFTITSGEGSGNNAWSIGCRASSTTASDTQSGTVTLTVNDRPHAAWDDPSSEGEWLHGTETLNASSSSDTDGAINNYLFELDDSTGFDTPSTLCSGASATCSFDTTTQGECAQNDNENCFLKVTVTDNDGATNSSIRRIGIDNTGPVSSLDMPRNSENISADSFTVNASVSDSGIGGISVASFEYREGPAYSWFSACNDSDGAPYECLWDLSGLPDGGSYEVRVRANDSLGNLGDYSTHTGIIIDRVKPNVLLHLPIEGYTTQSTTVGFNFTAVNSFAQSFNCTLYIDSLPNASNASTQNNTATNFTVSDLSEGVHTWYVNCTDYAQNSNVSETRLFRIDYTKPSWSAQNQTIAGLYSTIVHRGETVVLKANWTDNGLLDEAWLETNETGSWENKSGLYGSPQDLSAANESSFSWSTSSIASGTKVFWRIHANDTAGNMNATDLMNYTIWAWSKINASSLSPSEINLSQTTIMRCQVVENATGLAIENYPVGFYNSTGLMGTNATGADGWAAWNFTGQVIGLETITCKITDNATLYFNISGESESMQYLSIQETGAPKIYRMISDPCERGTYCRAGIAVYNPNPTAVTVTNVTDTWSTDYVSSIRQCCTPDGCSAAYCSEISAGTIRFINQSAWTISAYGYIVMWYEILNTNTAGTVSLTTNVTSLEWQPVSSTRADVDVINARACAWTSWSENGTEFDTNSSPAAVLKVDAGSTKEYTVRLFEFCNQAALSSANNRLVIDVPSGWSYVALSAYWVGGGGSCSYDQGTRKLTCILPADIQNTYKDLKLQLTAPSSLEKYNFTTSVNGTDVGGTTHEDVNTHLILIRDYSRPNYTLSGANQTAFHRGESISLNAYWQDNYLLSEAVLSTNESGAWVNHSGIYGSPLLLGLVNSSWSNFTWMNSSKAPGSRIYWRIYVNDTSGNANYTDALDFYVWGYANTSTSLGSQSVLKGNPVNVSCFVRDRYDGSGVNNHPVTVYSNGEYIASGSTTSGWFNTTYSPASFGAKTITCNISDDAGVFYNATGNSFGLLEVNDSYSVNFTITNSTNETYEDSSITIYDLQGNPVASDNESIETSLQIWQEYNIVLDIAVNSTDTLKALIRKLNITDNLTLNPQVVLNYTGELPDTVGVVTPLFALNDSSLAYNNTELQIPKNGLLVEKIIHCLSWNYSEANCSSWEVLETADMGMVENSTHIMFNVTGFDAWGGGAGNPLPNVTEIRIYNVSGLGDTHTGGTLIGTGLNDTFVFWQRAPELYRVEIDVMNDGKAQWKIDSSDMVYHSGLNSTWTVNGTNDVWYTIDTSTYTGGNFTNGKVSWNMSLGGTLAKAATMTYYYVFNMTGSDPQNYGVYFVCNDTSSNSGSNDSSVYSVSKIGYLEVLLTLPPQIPGQGNATNDTEILFKVGANRTFIMNATVYCRDGFCDNVNGTLRYNYSTLNPSAPVNTTAGDKPFYVYSGVNPIDCPTNPLGVNEFCNVTWSVNSTGDLHSIYSFDVLFQSNLSATNDTGDVSIEITKVLIMNLSWDTTNFGVCEPTSTGNPADLNDEGYNITIDPNSNDVDGIYVKGTNLDPESVINFSTNFYGIGVGNITWNHEDNYDDSKKLTSEYALVNDSVSSNTTIRTYYWIDIPKGQYTQDYKGKLYVMANASV